MAEPREVAMARAYGEAKRLRCDDASKTWTRLVEMGGQANVSGTLHPAFHVIAAILRGEVVLPPEAMPEPPRCSCWMSGTRRVGWTDDDPCPVHPEHRSGALLPVERGEVDGAD